MRRTAILLMCFALAGCSMFSKKGNIRIGKDEVTAVPDAGKPATLERKDGKETVPIPKDTDVTITKTEATPTAPATEVTRVHFNSPTEWQKFTASVAANTGTVDTSVALHKVDVAERRILLYIAIGCAIAGVVLKSMLPAWPALSNGLLLAAPLAFAAWKFSEVPAWAWFAVLVGVGLMVIGYKRAEWDANNDGVPDFLQKQKPVVVVAPAPPAKV